MAARPPAGYNTPYAYYTNLLLSSRAIVTRFATRCSKKHAMCSLHYRQADVLTGWSAWPPMLVHIKINQSAALLSHVSAAIVTSAANFHLSHPAALPLLHHPSHSKWDKGRAQTGLRALSHVMPMTTIARSSHQLAALALIVGVITWAARFRSV